MPDTTRVLDGGEKFIIIDQDNPDPLMEYFVLRLTNAAGVLQHQIISSRADLTLLAPNYVTKIFGASATAQNTPQVAAGVGFTSGVGVNAANTSDLEFDTLDQDNAEAAGFAYVESNSTGAAAPNVRIQNQSINVNGVTRNRLALTFTVDGSGANWPVTVASIPAGSISVRVGVQVR